jgi:hypothetical protein
MNVKKSKWHMQDPEFPPLKAETMDNNGAVRLLEKVFRDSATAYMGAYAEYLAALDRGDKRDISNARSNMSSEEHFLRRSPLVRGVAYDVAELIESLKRKAVEKYMRRKK